MRSVVFLAPCFLLACSGADFGVGGDTPDSTSEDAADDSSLVAEAGEETATDASLETTESDAADGSTVDASAMETAGDSGSDTADVCVKNACGGCLPLVGMPGDPCPSCGGKLACVGTDKLECDSTTPKNACGGCSVLATPPGGTCGVCATGKYVCNGTDATKCADPVTGPAPMTACGTCKTKKVICDATSAGGTKCEGDDANACGGCGTLSPALGGVCGVCSGGTYVCDSMTKATKCSDPVPAGSPAVGSACGTCGTLKYACAGDKKSVVCPADDANECGGCMHLVNKPGATCGYCTSGSYVCNGKEATKCNDPVTTPPGTVCGICSKSKYACSGSTTACAMPDDRNTVDDILCYAPKVVLGMIRTQPSYPYYYALWFTTQRAGAVTGFTLQIGRTLKDATVTDPGSFTIRLIKGTPTLTPLASDVLATTTISGDISTTSAVPVTLSAPTASLPAGTALYVELTHNSLRFDYQIRGDDIESPSKTDLWVAGPGDTAYKLLPSVDPGLSVQMKGCY